MTQKYDSLLLLCTFHAAVSAVETISEHERFVTAEIISHALTFSCQLQMLNVGKCGAVRFKCHMKAFNFHVVNKRVYTCQ
jgi:hypothetical protein